ncbi:hypothetical protein ACLOJK_000061 [Asimina triloba]
MEVASAAAAPPVPSGNNMNGGTPQRRAKQTLRGLNKPKCIQCGNVARSRCPFQSCKNCCAKAENLCHIHVLKSNSTLLDKPPPSSSSIDQSSSDTPTGASLRVSSLRQLSNSFAQFNRAQLPLRARKPLSRKDAAAINAWRFSKLKEHNERNIEIENEAFDRYMQNVSLLEEAFYVDSLSKLATDGSSAGTKASTSGEDETSKMVAAMKGRLKSNVERAGGFRKRVRDLVEQGLRKLQRREFDDEGKSGNADGPKNERKPRKPKKIEKWGTEMPAAVNDLLEKLRKVRSADELKSCLETKLPLLDHNYMGQADGHEDKDAKAADGQSGGNMSIGNPQSGPFSSSYAVPKPYTSVEISQEDLSDVNLEFSSHNQIAEL